MLVCNLNATYAMLGLHEQSSPCQSSSTNVVQSNYLQVLPLVSFMFEVGIICIITRSLADYIFLG